MGRALTDRIFHPIAGVVLGGWLLLTACGVNGMSRPVDLADQLLSDMADVPWEKVEPVLQQAESCSAYVVAFGPQGKHLATTGYGSVCVWEAASGRLVREFVASHRADAPAPIYRDIVSVAISHSGAWIAAGVRDGTLRLWDMATGAEWHTLYGHQYGLRSVAFSSDDLWISTGSHDGTVRLWDVESGVQIRVFEAHTENSEVVRFSPDDRYLVSGGTEGTVRLWNIETGEQVGLWAFKEDGLRYAGFSPDGRLVHVATFNGKIGIWELSTGRQDIVAEGQDERLYGYPADLSRDGRFVVLGGDGMIALIEVQTGDAVRLFRTDNAQTVRGVAFAPDGRRFASSGYDGIVRVWDRERTVPVLEIIPSTSAAIVAVRPNLVAASAYAEKSVDSLNLYTFRDGRPRITGQLSIRRWDVGGVSNDGRYVVTDGPLSPMLTLWTADGQFKRRMEWKEPPAAIGESYTKRAYAFSADAQLIAVGGQTEPTIRVWEVETGEFVLALDGPTQQARSLEFSPDGRMLLSSSEDGIRLWSMETGRLLHHLSSKKEGRQEATFSPDGRAVAYSGDDHPLRILDLTTWESIMEFGGAARELFMLTFSSDGRLIAAVEAMTSRIRVWDVQTGQGIYTIENVDDMGCLRFNATGEYLLTCKAPTQLQIHDLTTAQVVATVVLFKDGEWLIFTPEGYYDASKNGAEYLAYRLDNRIYGVADLASRYYRPDVIREIMTAVIE